MANARVLGLSMLWGSVGLALLSMALPWDTIDGPAGHFDFYVWGVSGEGGTEDWYNEGFDPIPGIDQVRGGMSFVTTGTLLLIIGGGLLLGRKHTSAGVLATIGGPMLLLGTLSHIAGVGGDGDGVRVDGSYGLVPAFLAGAVALAAGIIVLVKRPRKGAQPLPMGIPGAAPWPPAPNAAWPPTEAGNTAWPPASAPSYTAAGSTPRPAAANAVPSTGMRTLRCPKCANTFQVAAGVRPTCSRCGFGA